MARCNSCVAKYCLLILASVVIFSCALVNHQVNAWSQPRALLRLQSTSLFASKIRQSSGAKHRPPSSNPDKSPESNFWMSIAQNTTASSNGIPAIPRLDRETGPLPPGAYRNMDRDVAAPCLIAVGIQPPMNKKGGVEVWREATKSCQALIDSGFNTFRVNNCYGNNKVKKTYVNRRRKSPSSINLEHMQQRALQTENRHDAETNFYRSLRQSTPPSVLRSCHFMVNMEIPSILSDDSAVVTKADEEISPVSFGNGWMVRESISNALLRSGKGELDSVILEYRERSPYHLDTLNTLFEMKDEGLIQSISTQKFPPQLLRSALDCGFSIHSNDVHGNLMNTNNLQADGELGILCNDHGCSRLISAPLGGGLFTDKYCQYKELEQMSASSKKMFQTLLDSCCNIHPEQKWKRYRTIVDTLVYISVKYQVSVESIALRWLLQLNDGDGIFVGTHLGMDFVEEQGGKPYSRQRDLRQVFTFCLEEDDMERLCKVTGFTSDRHHQSGRMSSDHEIDFTNKALWI